MERVYRSVEMTSVQNSTPRLHRRRVRILAFLASYRRLTNEDAPFGCPHNELLDVGSDVSQEKTHRQERDSNGERECCGEDGEHHDGVQLFCLRARRSSGVVQ